MLSVVPDDAFAQEQIHKNNKIFESAISHAAATDTPLDLVSRVDLNVANGISRAIKELMIDKVVLGWNGKMTTTNFFFGSIIENLITSTDQMVMVVKSAAPFDTINRIIVSTPPNAECEAGFSKWIDIVKVIASRTSSNVVFMGIEKILSDIGKQMESNGMGIKVEYRISNTVHPITEVALMVTDKDLFIVITARRRTLSYSSYFDHMPKDLARHYDGKSFLIIYPEQKLSGIQTLSSSLDGLDISPIQESFERFSNIGKFNKKSSESNHNSPTE